MASSTAQEFFQRYEQVKAVEQSRNELIEDLLRRVAELENAYQQTRLDHERESRFNREVQMHEIELMNQITAMESVMEQEPFLLVLLDGDGMVFQDSFLQQGEQGGKDGANQLWAAIRDYASRNLPNIQSPKIIARVYANVKGLADACYKAGLIERPGLIEEFARGFNGSRLLFDFVDVGSGKDRADDKIAEMFKLHLYNCHCHQIFLGCSHDNGYARLLEDTLADRDLVGRISLIEGVPFERELVPIKASYRVTKFEELFRTSKINTNSLSWNDRNGTNNNPMSIPSSTPLSVLSANTPGNNNNLARIPSNSTIPSNGTNTPPTWAATTAAGAHGPFTDLTTSKPSSPAPPKVERNKYGERVDRLDFKTIPKDELNRVKKLKLCNLYYLLGDCPNLSCYHTHDHKLTKNERTVLHAVARMTPCRFGTDCDDPGCIYGHRCPQSEIGKKDCFWGSNCRFDTAAHGIDTTIVKVTKV
ncbi:C-x8-C-x5-C-x3-H zinc finger protein [Histoplasma capsulatum G186AR]|uniref:C-x8-C-x5-C-x3-H zinc finger protein n=2 Tax=Ajellomyces capsulatus TaxID=5037 RepID=C0NWI8_AJECG|nr:C-x8-C-x5-C-x3-H zinc finger protein [Histoplasma capsulatum G186AR]EEH04293.1 C-x8-C-x5-C-x3-H zinc finger protein [Histoplasma capsulatum G186AR]KAG5291251.1 C-x8-C-x5-C-x3-H zinc finger protein [Histoplasma capsulatum]QSS68554.1 C-x8-C-x5-C-x3-H zinc finger protein [Histoplasma capsulatum G186AR]